MHFLISDHADLFYLVLRCLVRDCVLLAGAFYCCLLLKNASLPGFRAYLLEDRSPKLPRPAAWE